MTYCNSVNAKLSNLQLNKLKPAIKSGIKLTSINLLPNVIGDSNEDTNFPNELSLADRQVSKLHKPFANNLSTNI